MKFVPGEFKESGGIRRVRLEERDRNLCSLSENQSRMVNNVRKSRHHDHGHAAICRLPSVHQRVSVR